MQLSKVLDLLSSPERRTGRTDLSHFDCGMGSVATDANGRPARKAGTRILEAVDPLVVALRNGASIGERSDVVTEGLTRIDLPIIVVSVIVE
jgi:hypothetical protein